MPKANTPAHSTSKAGSCCENTRLAITPTLSAMTSFLNSPQMISTTPLRALSASHTRGCSTCTRRFLARMIGPATRCGKNATNSAKSTGLRRARISPL